MLRQIEARGDLNVFSYLKHVRRQRNHLVQTEEQYIFIHDAVVEAIEAGETHINKTCLSRYIHGLQCIDVTDEKNHPPKVLEKQHKVNIKIFVKRLNYWKRNKLKIYLFLMFLLCILVGNYLSSRKITVFNCIEGHKSIQK